MEFIQLFDRDLLAVDTLAKKGNREILYALAKGKALNFTELKDLVGSPTTASQRLQELTGWGLVGREVQPDRFRSVRYSLTQKGERAVKLMRELEKLLAKG